MTMSQQNKVGGQGHNISINANYGYQSIDEHFLLYSEYVFAID